MPQYQVTNWRNYSHCDFYDHEALHPQKEKLTSLIDYQQANKYVGLDHLHLLLHTGFLPELLINAEKLFVTFQFSTKQKLI